MRGDRWTKAMTHQVDAAPEVVFPLLCPVRENEWVPGWHGEVVHARSGFAEPDGVFVAGGPDRSDVVFIVVRHDPPRAVSYIIVAEGLYVEKLDIELERLDRGSRLTWTRIVTGLGPAGNEAIFVRRDAFEATMGRIAHALARHLADA